jgi:hypothetical protein
MVVIRAASMPTVEVLEVAIMRQTDLALDLALATLHGAQGEAMAGVVVVPPQ